MSLSASYGRSRPAGGHELRAWLFMRVSGILLLFLALGHLAVMHLINNVDVIDYAFVAKRYEWWVWRGYDWLLLMLAMLHGTIGARILIDDYLHHPGWRRVALAVLYGGCGGLLVLGTIVAFFFQPVASP